MSISAIDAIEANYKPPKAKKSQKRASLLEMDDFDPLGFDSFPKKSKANKANKQSKSAKPAKAVEVTPLLTDVWTLLLPYLRGLLFVFSPFSPSLVAFRRDDPLRPARFVLSALRIPRNPLRAAHSRRFELRIVPKTFLRRLPSQLPKPALSASRAPPAGDFVL